jgi:hypothetical protein
MVERAGEREAAASMAVRAVARAVVVKQAARVAARAAGGTAANKAAKKVVWREETVVVLEVLRAVWRAASTAVWTAAQPEATGKVRVGWLMVPTSPWASLRRHQMIAQRPPTPRLAPKKTRVGS